MRLRLVTTGKIPYLCYDPYLKSLLLLLFFLFPFVFVLFFPGVSLESGTERNVVYISSSSKDDPVISLTKAKSRFARRQSCEF